MPTKFPRPYFRSQRGTWCIQLDGRPITLSSDKDEAFRMYHRLLAERGQEGSLTLSSSAPLVVVVLDAYLDWLYKRVQEGTKAQRTFDWYKKFLSSFGSF